MHLCRLLIICGILLLSGVSSKKFKENEKPKWAQKDIRDFSDADMERLLDQWEVISISIFKRIVFTIFYLCMQEDEEPLEDDELPEHLRPQATIDMKNIDMTNPENLLKATKKGKTLMAFVQVNGNPTKDEAETLTKLWQGSLWNSHIQAERYLL